MDDLEMAVPPSTPQPGNFRKNWTKLDKKQKFSVLSLFIAAFALPVLVVAGINQNLLRSNANPITPPVTPPGTNVNWQTIHAGLSATAVRISANGARFKDQAPDTNTNSDPGSPTYTTLETTWHENGQEMRVYIYFASDGVNWWATEIRTYGALDGSWIYYKAGAPYFTSPLGQAYTGDITLTSDSNDAGDVGQLIIKNAQIWAFSGPQATQTPAPTPPNNVAPSISTTGLPSGNSGVLYTANVVATDANIGDSLTLTATGLPAGLGLSNCVTTTTNQTTLTCTLSGLPTTRGRYSVVFTVTDAAGATGTRTITLGIQ